jgi:hypothetical protein
MSLQYANKAVKDLEDKVRTAIKLWGDEEDIKQMEAERLAEKVAATPKKKLDIVERHSGFFAFNNEQFREGYQKTKELLNLDEGEKVVHVGAGLYIPKRNVDSFMQEYGN